MSCEKEKEEGIAMQSLKKERSRGYYGKMLCIFPNISGKAEGFSEKSKEPLGRCIFLLFTVK